MRTAIGKILSAMVLAGLAGCEGNAQPVDPPILRYQVDQASGRSWALTRDALVVRKAADASSVKLTLPGWLWAAAPSCPPDLAIGPDGEALITSNVVPTIWRVDARTLAVTVHSLELDEDSDKDVGFAALVFSPSQAAYVAYSETQRSVWKIDAHLQRATKLQQGDFGTKRRGPCAGLSRRLAHFAGTDN